MNYLRIYNEFVRDRRRKEPTLRGYTELHHVVPRSNGGDDSPQNLLRLTAEDHIRAHLLLARILGGTQWHAVLQTFRGKRHPTRRMRKAAAMAKEHRSIVVSAASKAMWEDPEHRARHSAAIKTGRRKPETRERVSAASKAMWEDPAYRAQQQKARWENPAYREKASAASKARWQDPAYRARASAASKAQWDDPELRARKSAATKTQMNDPELRAKVSAAVSAAQTALWQNPEHRARMTAARKARWDDPEYRRNHAIGMLFARPRKGAAP